MNVNELVDRSSSESSPMQASADPQVIEKEEEEGKFVCKFWLVLTQNKEA